MSIMPRWSPCKSCSTPTNCHIMGCLTLLKKERQMEQEGPQAPQGRLEMIARETIQRCLDLMKFKNGEYAHSNVDDLAQFRREAQKLNLPMETIWHVYIDKHWSALEDYINELRQPVGRVRLEKIGGRVDDLIVYLLIFQAMLDEREQRK